VRRGEIWGAEAPEVGRRPYLVLTRDAAIPLVNAILAVPATRTVRRIPTEAAIGPDEGRPDAGALTLDNATGMPKAFFVERISELGPDLMASVCRALAHAASC